MAVINQSIGGGGGGIKINGTEKEFKSASGSVITSGSFIRLVGEAGVDTKLVSTSSSGSNFYSVKLSNNRVFVAYRYGSNSYLYGIVLTINGTNITYGTSTRLSTIQKLGLQNISITALDDDRVLVCHNGASGSYYIQYFIITTSEMSISVGDQYVLSEYYMANGVMDASLLPNNKIAIVYTPSSSSSFVCALKICSIANNELIDSDDASETYITDAMLNSSLCFISVVYENTHLVIYPDHSGNLSAAVNVISTDGTYTTVGTNISLDGYEMRNNSILDIVGGDIVRYPSGLFAYVVFSRADYNTGISDLYGAKIAISENGELTAGDGIPLIYGNSGYGTATYYMAVSASKENEVYIFYGHENNLYLYCTRVSFGEEISISPPTQLSTTVKTGYTIKTVKLDNGNILVLHSSGGTYRLHGTVFNPNIATEGNNIINVGVASSSGSDGQTIKANIPYTEQE